MTMTRTEANRIAIEAMEAQIEENYGQPELENNMRDAIAVLKALDAEGCEGARIMTAENKRLAAQLDAIRPHLATACEAMKARESTLAASHIPEVHREERVRLRTALAAFKALIEVAP